MKPYLSPRYLFFYFINFFLLLPLFTPGVPITHDGENHLARFAAYYHAFSDGHFPPRWAETLNYGYGTPVLNFFYPLPGYLASVLHLFAFSYEVSFKILLTLTLVISNILFFLFARKVWDEKIAFVLTILYALIPYRLLNMYVRGDIGELFALAFIPGVLYSIESFSKERKSHYLLFGGICYGLTILSHHGLALMFSPVIGGYIFLKMIEIKEWKMRISFLSIIGSGLLLSSFFWLPALIEGKYTNAAFFIGDFFRNNFIPFTNILYSQWGFGPSIQEAGGLSPQLGILFGIGVGASLYYVLRKKITVTYLFWILVFLLGIFLSTSLSSVLWEKIKILKLYQFPWRFTALSTFSSVMLIGYLFSLLSERGRWVFILTCTLLTIPFIRVQDVFTYPDSYYESHTGTTTFHGEDSTIWQGGIPSTSPLHQFAVIEGEGEIREKERKSHIHEYEVLSQADIKVVDNTFYFPGWKVFVDGEETPIQFQDPNHRGLITFSVPQGEHAVSVQFTETKLRVLANTLTVFSFILIGSLFLLRKKIDLFYVKK